MSSRGECFPLDFDIWTSPQIVVQVEGGFGASSRGAGGAQGPSGVKTMPLPYPCTTSISCN